jgi:hypothetical protein
VPDPEVDLDRAPVDVYPADVGEGRASLGVGARRRRPAAHRVPGTGVALLAHAADLDLGVEHRPSLGIEDLELERVPRGEVRALGRGRRSALGGLRRGLDGGLRRDLHALRRSAGRGVRRRLGGTAGAGGRRLGLGARRRFRSASEAPDERDERHEHHEENRDPALHPGTFPSSSG